MTKHLRTLFVLALLGISAPNMHPLGQSQFVSTTRDNGSFPISDAGAVAAICVSPADFAGVRRAAGDLAADIERVTGAKPSIITADQPSGRDVILIGTLGKSPVIDRLVGEGRVDASRVAGKWETYLIQTVSDPAPGVSRALVIAGSDKRGTIFGIYDVSEQIGVSPWHWFADVTPRRSQNLFVKPGTFVEGPPAVQYRGIFLNDEAPALTGWAREKFGGLNHGFYTNVFELLLRLKGNYLWPAMWDNSFATDDPLNTKLADEYGIVVSTSHHEPMMRAWKEWGRAGNRQGTWDYSRNDEKLRAFWEEGIRRTKDYEKVITLAMRGDGDEPMSETESVALLERIVADQRKIISDVMQTNIESVPQVWALYKEVQGYYEKGMRVPDDVTLLWCDDNWGNIRRLPTAEERKRKGGAGIYYHFDYVGGPRNYKWLNTSPITKVWEQMNLAHDYGANRLWIVNVGDLKPMEFPIEFFISFGWDPKRWPKERIQEFTELWAAREFGAAHAREIAHLMSEYTKFNGRRKPELLEPGTFSLLNYREADRVLADWNALVASAQNIRAALPPGMHDAFFQLVQFPIEACANLNDLYVSVAKNHLHAAQGRASANYYADRAEALFQKDRELTQQYHSLGNGRWNHMMSQTHIGYTSWQQPPSNRMPRVTRIEPAAESKLRIAIEGSTNVWTGTQPGAELPAFHRFNPQAQYVELFNGATNPIQFNFETSAPWIRASANSSAHGMVHRVEVDVDWDRAANGTNSGFVKISSPDAEPTTIAVTALNIAKPSDIPPAAFLEANGFVSIEAEHFSRSVDSNGARWEIIPRLGNTLSAVSVFPTTAASVEQPPANSPRLEYPMYLLSAGTFELTTVVSPSLNFMPDRSVRIAVSFDDEAPQVLTILRKGYTAGDGVRDWEESVRNSVRRVKSTHTISKPGLHTLKVWMVDPGVVVQKLVLDTGGVKPSYLGPPESLRARNAR